MTLFADLASITTVLHRMRLVAEAVLAFPHPTKEVLIVSCITVWWYGHHMIGILLRMRTISGIASLVNICVDLLLAVIVLLIIYISDMCKLYLVR